MVVARRIDGNYGTVLDGPIQHASAAEIQHDAEHYMLLAQHGERWMREDKEVAAKLEEIRNKNGGKPPNILFVLIDDVGFGEMGETTQRRFLCVGIKERQLEI